MSFDHFFVLEGLAADGTRWKAVNLIAMRSIIANCVETNLGKKTSGDLNSGQIQVLSGS